MQGTTFYKYYWYFVYHSSVVTHLIYFFNQGQFKSLTFGQKENTNTINT